MPFPVITQEKIEKYNLDLFEHLDANEVELTVQHLEGLANECYLKLYVGSEPNERFRLKVCNGAQKQATTIIKLPEKEMQDVVRGKKPVFVLRFFDKNFWGNYNQLGEFQLVGGLTRVNLVEEKATSGQLTVLYELRVHKPSKPLTTEILHVTMKSLPVFRVHVGVQDQLVKYCLAEFKR